MYRGGCSNRLTIRRDRPEDQLLEAFEKKVLRPDMAAYLATRFEPQLRARIKQMTSQNSHSAKAGMEKRRDELRVQAKRISAAIGLGGSLDSLVAQLTVVESEIKTLKPVKLNSGN